MNKTTRNFLTPIAIAILYALIVYLVFGMDVWGSFLGIMSIGFLFCTPVVIGILTLYFSDIKKVESKLYSIFAPWIPILLLIIITMGLSLEGWACWLIISPVFLIASSLGGIIGRYIRIKKRSGNIQISVLIILPFIIGPIEGYIDTIPATYRAYTYIDIDAPAHIIWDHVTQVAEIDKTEDTGYLNKLLGFPRPVKAELNYEGVGARREAIFTKGLVFHENVIEYVDNRKMVFTIKAYPYEIPSTTLDEHITIGGDYFDVLTGTYEIEGLPNGQNRLHLYSDFKMNTTFNFYSGWWAKWIMKDIQNNILRVEKKRAERK